MTDINQVIAELSNRLVERPEMADEIRAKLAGLSEEERKAFDIAVRGIGVRELPIGLEGARHYYFCKYGWEPPKHVLGWMREILGAYLGEAGVLLEGFRGSTKSTTATTTCEYLLGKNPHKSGLITAATETDANSVGKFMSDTIALNAGWKACFPDIVPDTERGWGAEGGYFVKDVSMPYAEWVQMTMKDHQRDPSLLAVSISSAVGKHPSLFLLCDDIHTGKNTSSATELNSVKNRFYSDVFPTMNRPAVDGERRPFFISTFTPWSEEDTNAELKRSGVYKHVRTPILEFVPDGKYEFDGDKCNLMWEEAYGIEKVRELRSMNTSVEFARMYLCDLKRAKVSGYKYQTYPHEKIDPRWIRGAGVDYASVQAPTRAIQGGRSHYALAEGTKTPMNTIVLVGGVVGQFTMTEGSEHVRTYQNRAVNWRRTAIEIDGKGEEFWNYVRLNPDILTQPRKVAGLGNKMKRQFDLFDKILPNGILTISDANDEFLNTFRYYLDNYPNIEKTYKAWDVADAVYHMVSVFPECLAMPVLQAQEFNVMEKKIRKSSPWASIGRA